MSRLIVYPESNPSRSVFESTDADEIAMVLGKVGVRFERWQAAQPLTAETDDQGVLDAYRADIDRLMRERGYQSVDTIRCLPDNPNRDPLRRKFLEEHTHDDDEVRFFVEGSGVFYLRLEGKVHVALCERNDLLSVPAGTRHWFDMGPSPFFTAIRLFTTPAGWVAQFTGDRIAQRFPSFENVAA